MIKFLNKRFDALIDKYKLDKSAFIAYTFYLITLFIVINSVFEILYIIFVGVATMYLHPIVYALEMLCPAIAYMYVCSSPYAKSPSYNVKYLVMAAAAFYIIILSMLFQWINKFIWMALIKIPNFPYVIDNMPETIIPAVVFATLTLPIFTIPWIFKWYIDSIKNDRKYVESIEDYEGKVTSKQVVPTGPFTCEVALCVDAGSTKTISTPEKRRYESTLIQGATGTGKTATMIEPMCAFDIEKKFFFRETAKQLGFHALQAGLATLTAPVSSDVLNYNFSLSYLTPKENKYNEFKKLVENLILYEDKTNKKLYYKDLGLTLVAPDAECISRVRNVAKNYNMKVNYIDPLDDTSLGMNPFILEDPAQVAVIISTVLKGMYEAENGGESNIFFANVTQQALENLTILLKVMYPKMNNGNMPTLEDMLKMLYDFNLVEQTCEEMKKDPILSEEYKVLIGYFERNFYKPPVNINGYEIPGVVGSGRKDTERFIYGAITQLDNLLRHPGIKNIICNRNNNIAMDSALERGEIITLCSQKGSIGGIMAKAFGMFFILAFQYAVLRRPGNEDQRIPHFLYIDEFPDFINKETETCFTQFRKFRCGMVVAIQNLSQLQRTAAMRYYREVVLTNTKTQIIFGDTNFEDSKYWSDTLGIKKEWEWGISWTPSKESSPSTMAGIKQETKQKYQPGKIQDLGFKLCIYRTKDAAGKTKIGKGKTDFINKRHLEPHDPRIFNFEPFVFNSSSSAFFSGDDSDSYSSSDNTSSNIHTVNIVKNVTKPDYVKPADTNPIVSNDSFSITFDDNLVKEKKKKAVAIEEFFDHENVITFNNDDKKNN